MSHRDWSRCRDIQVRKSDNGSSQQRGERDRVTDLGEKLLRYVDFSNFSPSLPVKNIIAPSSNVLKRYHHHLESSHVFSFVDYEAQSENLSEVQQISN